MSSIITPSFTTQPVDVTARNGAVQPLSETVRAVDDVSRPRVANVARPAAQIIEKGIASGVHQSAASEPELTLSRLISRQTVGSASTSTIAASSLGASPSGKDAQISTLAQRDVAATFDEHFDKVQSFLQVKDYQDNTYIVDTSA